MNDTRPVFLHTGWRSLGTWLWSAFRERPNVLAYYEPLHERLASLSLRGIAQFRPGNWSSGHGGVEPYFAEFEPLLRPDGRGVAGYARRFAFDNYFAPVSHPDPELEAYLRTLLRTASNRQRRPVLKFCRSLGRIDWLRARFPEALHLLVLRDPWPMWISGRRQLTEHHNQYFVQAPFVILARNRENPLVAASTAALAVRTAPTLGRDLGVAFETAERHVRRLDWSERYRGFLAFWLASSLAALRSGVEIVDATALATSAEYREAFAARHEVRLQPEIESTAGQPLLLPGPAEAAAHEAAAAFIRQAGGPDWLAARLPTAAGAAPPPSLEESGVAWALRHADAALYVAAKRLSYPLRRLHGEVNRRWPGRVG